MESVPFFISGPIAFDGLEERARKSEGGVVLSFQGVVRGDRTPRGAVVALEFEGPPQEGESRMVTITREVENQWPGTRVLFQHRVGKVPAGETSVFLVVSSPERASALAACHYTLDQMKSRIPLRKKDYFSDGSSQWCDDQRETLLISDSVLTYPAS